MSERLVATGLVKEASGRAASAPRVVAAACLAVVVAASFAGAVGQARHKPLWHDEIFTFYISAAGGLRDVLSTFTVPIDLSPPGYHVAAFLTQSVLGQTPLVTRLPAILGFAVAVLALFAFVRRLAGSIPAAAAASMLVLSGAYPYAYEARSYALILGLGALTLVSWQRATRDGGWYWHVALALTLAAAVASHYYAILLIAPLSAGEVVRWFERRRMPWAIIVAVGLSMAILLPLMPLMRAARGFQATYWSRPTSRSILDAYRELAEPLLVPLLIIVAVLALARMLGRPGGEAVDDQKPPVRAEVVALAVLAVIPVIAQYSLAQVSGAFASRYVIEASLGLAALAGLAVAAMRASGNRLAAAVALLLALMAVGKALPAARFIGAPPLDPISAAAKKALAIGGQPVVVTSVVTYLELWHHSPGTRARLVSLRKPEELVQQGLPDTGGRNLAALARLVPLHVETFERYVASHDRFLVLGPRTWMIDSLLHSGATLSLLAGEDNEALYEAHFRQR